MSRDDRHSRPDDSRDAWIGDALREERSDDALPPGFYARARERFERESGAERRRPAWLRPLPWLGTAAAAALLALVFLPRLHDSSGTLARPEATKAPVTMSDIASEEPAKDRVDEPALELEALENESSAVDDRDTEGAAPQDFQAKLDRVESRPAAAPSPSRPSPAPPEPEAEDPAAAPQEVPERLNRLKKAEESVARKEKAQAQNAPATELRERDAVSAELKQAPGAFRRESRATALADGFADSGLAAGHLAATSPEWARSGAWPGPPVPEDLLEDWKAGSEVWWIPGQSGYRLVCRVEPEAQTSPGPLQVTVVRVPSNRAQAAAGSGARTGPGCLVRLELAGRTATIVYKDAEE